jgi:hypothetical protein
VVRSGRPRTGDVRLSGTTVPARDARALKRAAEEDGTTVPEQVRRAISSYIRARVPQRARKATSPCPAVLMLRGGYFQCDQPTVPHDGLAHSSRAAEAIWVEKPPD